MKSLSLLLIVLLSAASLFASTPIETAHKASLQILQRMFMIGGAGCSATAIGPHAILTATHCELPTDVLYISGFATTAKITGRIRDGQDHTIYLVTGVKFDTYVDVVPTEKFTQGEDVFIFGNPGGWSDMYRRGYFSGTMERESGPDFLMFDFQDWHGDSGAAIFNTAGQVVGVISTHAIQAVPEDPTDAIRMTGAFALAFTQSDLDRARVYSDSTLTLAKGK